MVEVSKKQAIETSQKEASNISDGQKAQRSHSRFTSCRYKAEFNEVIQRFENHQFQSKKRIDVENANPVDVYDIDYEGEEMGGLEGFDEGEFTFAKRVKFVRKYVVDSVQKTLFIHYSQVFDHTLGEEGYRGQIAIFHGFAQCQDTFFEMAMQYALNGFLVHLIDFEGFGFSGGKRIAGLRIENMHRQVTTMLEQVRPDLPLFLLAHSMGGLILNSYLYFNPHVASQVAGVIYSAPLWGFPDYVQIDPVMKAILPALAGAIDEFVLGSGMPIHMICRNRTYMRRIMLQCKALPLMSVGLLDSMIRNMDLVQAKAREVTYPFLLVMGEKDIIVNNKVTKQVFAKTSSKLKSMRLMPSAFHELSKEPNSATFFEASLKFMAERLAGKGDKPAGPFGSFKHTSVKYYRPRPLLKRKKFWIWILVIVYLIVGLIMAKKRGMKRAILTWPKLL